MGLTLAKDLRCQEANEPALSMHHAVIERWMLLFPLRVGVYTVACWAGTRYQTIPFVFVADLKSQTRR
jgi:hypothetical protein